MDASVTFRLPVLAMSREERKTPAIAAEQPVAETGLSDEVLLAQVSEGSREALGVLFRRYARLIHTISNRILRDRTEADDLLQDIFLFIHHKSVAFDSSKSSARSWIVQMTYHRAIDRRRYLHSRHFYTRVDLNGATEICDPRSESREKYEPFGELVGTTTIRGLLDALTEDQRNTLSLHFFEGYTFGEIAVKLDQSLGNIRNHYYRGLDRLRKQMFPGKLPGRNGCGKK